MKSRMSLPAQGGYALLMILLALMGVGGVAAVSFTQEARQEAEEARYLHNQRVLREAHHQAVALGTGWYKARARERCEEFGLKNGA